MVLYPSRAESFGIVFLEAWSFGVPVVGCRAGAIRDVVEDGSVYFSLPAMLRSWPTVSHAWSMSQAKQMGSVGQRRASKEHTWAAVAKRARQALDAARTRMADQPGNDTS
jgi:glycosyltransferase involved in cell wall biosynthesis